jgi:putative MATE family efflux protein
MNILVLMRTPPEIIEDAHAFILVLLIGSTVLMLLNVQASIIRAVGDSKTPLYFMMVAVGFNIILALLFILVFEWGVIGASIGTVIGQLISVAVCFVYINKKYPVLRVTKEDWKITKRDVWEHFRLAIPMGLSVSIIAVGSIVVQLVLNGMGPIAVAGVTVAMRIDHIALMPLNSFGIAIGTYVAQNYGAGKFDRVRSGVFQRVIISIIFSAIIGGIVFFGGYTMAGFFVENGIEEVQSYAQLFLRINGSMYFILGLLFIYRFALQGLGKAIAPTVGSFGELIMRVFAAFVLASSFGFVGIAWANPLAWAGAAIPLGVLYYVAIRKIEKRQRNI